MSVSLSYQSPIIKQREARPRGGKDEQISPAGLWAGSSLAGPGGQDRSCASVFVKIKTMSLLPVSTRH